MTVPQMQCSRPALAAASSVPAHASSAPSEREKCPVTAVTKAALQKASLAPPVG